VCPQTHVRQSVHEEPIGSLLREAANDKQTDGGSNNMKVNNNNSNKAKMT